ncbi:MAG: NAD(P)H-hydrate dehydratase [Pyramidobacter sp.]|jgi:hydroxyethylthiazole kinase-like uncharacterized protein yjeF
MIPWYSSEKVRALDARLIEGGTPGLELMERVGRRIAAFVMNRAPSPSALILAGAGNNGGDGLVIARILLQNGWNVKVLLSHGPERSKGDAAVNLERFRALGGSLSVSSELGDGQIAALIDESGIVVDALLGTGASGAPRGETARLIELVNARRGGRAVLAVDLPSGAEGNGSCICAQWTCTAAARKLSLATGHGAAVAGEIHLVPLDPRAEAFLSESDADEPEAQDIRRFLPRHRADDHKGKRGGVLIAAGSDQYRGAALLAARGALRMGAGLVVLAAPSPVIAALTASLPEAIGEVLNKDSKFEKIMLKWKGRCETLLVGSGLGRDERAKKVCRAAEGWEGRSLWDGDGLYWMARDRLKPAECCLTPHEGEAARLLGAEKLDDRFAAARSLAERYGTSILKGFRSLVAEKGQKTWIISRGDRTLSVPGSGDVLAGAAAALLASGISPCGALAAAAWIHGAAGERLGGTQGRDGVLAHEVADCIPLVLKELNAPC